MEGMVSGAPGVGKVGDMGMGEGIRGSWGGSRAREGVGDKNCGAFGWLGGMGKVFRGILTWLGL